jgi:hypothetical protein
MTATKFAEWLASSQHGDRCEYHRGHVAHDRDKVRNPDGWEAVDAVAKAALQAAEAGDVDIVQRRHGPNDYGYIAQRRRAAVRKAA